MQNKSEIEKSVKALIKKYKAECKEFAKNRSPSDSVCYCIYVEILEDLQKLIKD